MVVSCCASGCKERFRKGGPYTFHLFPKDKNRRKLWVKQLQRENFTASDYTRICSKHFEAECFVQNFGRLCLKPHAVPTRFYHCNSSESEEMSEEGLDTEQLTIPGNATEQLTMSGNAAEQFPVPAASAADLASGPKSGKKFHSLDDFNFEDMDCPEIARKAFFLVWEQRKRRMKKIKQQKKLNRGLQKRVANLKEEIRKMSPNMPIPDSVGSPLKNAAASKEGPHPLEPTVVIKEEPVEFEPTPSTSADPDCQIKEEFILPHEENAWTAADSRPSGVDPSSQATFSVACLGTDLNNTSSTSPVLDDPLKRKRKVNPSKLSVSGPSQKIARTLDSGTVSTEPFGNADNSSNPSSLNESKTSGPRPHDHFDAFGEYIAAKLRSLDKRSCAFAQKAIGDIIFDAEMGKFMEGAK